MLRNLSNSNFTLAKLGWAIYPKGNINEWDGMTKWFIQYVDKNKYLLDNKYIKDWYLTAKRVLEFI